MFVPKSCVKYLMTLAIRVYKKDQNSEVNQMNGLKLEIKLEDRQLSSKV